jgi:hypothetical protein
MTRREAVHAQARGFAHERLLRAHSLLEAVTPDERAAIEETAYGIASRVADCLVDEAASCPPLAVALTEEAVLPVQAASA